MADSYRGVFGAIPYAIRHTDSWTMRAYGVVGTLAAVLITVVVTLGLVDWMAETAEVQSGVFLVTRAMYVVFGFAAVAPLLAPLLFVARRHRRNDPVAVGYDRKLAYTGFGFLASLYLGMLISAPADLREPTSSAVVGALYALPPLVGFVPPVVATFLLFWTHRRLRLPTDGNGTAESESDESETARTVDAPAVEDATAEDASDP